MGRSQRGGTRGIRRRGAVGCTEMVCELLVFGERQEESGQEAILVLDSTTARPPR